MSEDTANTQASEGQDNQSADGSFEPITTQEQLNSIVKGRVARAEANTRKAVEAEHAEALEKAKQYDALQEKNKSELEKERERAEKAEGELEKLRHEKQVLEWSREAAEKHGVDASLLRGGTLEELEAHAEQLKDAFGSAGKSHVTPNSGKPSEASSKDDIEDMLREAAGLKKKE